MKIALNMFGLCISFFQGVYGSESFPRNDLKHWSCSTQPTIREIIAKYEINGVEKAGGTDKDTAHSYVDVYTELLEPFRNLDIKILEIGTYRGGSALIWHDYLPKSQLFLIDMYDMIDLKIREALRPDRYRLEVMDAYCEHAIAKMQELCPEGFDIIIDDGNHELRYQLFSLKHYSSLLKKGGILVIEDVRYINYVKMLEERAPSNTRCRTFDLRSKKGRQDDILFVVTKNI